MKKNPEIELNSLCIVIQLLQAEIEESWVHLQDEDMTAEDQLWYEDLTRAAEDLKRSYINCIEENKIINYPSYERLISAKKHDL